MGTAFMFYSNSNKWAEGLEGWHGVDQLGDDGANPNYEAMIDRFDEAVRAHDPQRRRGAGLRHRPRRHPRHRQRRHPHAAARQGGHGAHPLDARHQRRPRTYIQFGPWDRKGYKGDFLTIRELRGGELRFDGYHRPEWPSNSSTPA